MQTASPGGVAEVVHFLCLAEHRRPRHFVQTVCKRNWVRDECQTIVQTTVCLDVQVLGILVRNIKQLLRVAAYRAAVVDFRFYAEMPQTLAVEKRGRACSCTRG